MSESLKKILIDNIHKTDERTIEFLTQELKDPIIHRILYVKNTNDVTENDIYDLIKDKTGISICGIHKNEWVCYVLFKTVDWCKHAFTLLKEKREQLVLKSKLVYFAKYKFNVVNFIFSNIKDVFKIEEVRNDMYWYRDEYYKVEYERSKFSNQRLDLQSKLAIANEALREHAYSKKRIDSLVENERFKEFEELKKKFIEQIKKFKI